MSSINGKVKNINNFYSRKLKTNIDKIKECEALISNGNLNSIRHISAYIFLCYRFLDKKFFNFELLSKNFDNCFIFIDSLACEGVKSRWKCSLIMAFTYVYINKNGCDDFIISIAKKNCDEKLLENWPDIMFNVLACCLIIILYSISQNRLEQANFFIEKSCELFKKAIFYVEIKGDFSIGDILKSTSSVFACITRLGAISGYEKLNYPADYVQFEKNFFNFLIKENESHLYFTVLKIIPELEYHKKDNEDLYIFYAKYGNFWQNQLPKNFNVEKYKYYNPDLFGLDDTKAKMHYLKYGILENRVYEIDELPFDFDARMYGALNKDITHMPNGWLEMHYSQHGKKENRKYKDDLFDEKFFIKENNIKNYSGYQDYLKDIRQIKSKKIKDLIDNLKEIKNCILLISHENSIYGATNYLYTVYKELKIKNKNVVLIDDFENSKLLNKFELNKNEVLFYEGDPTLLYWMCIKINPKLIYFNSMNSQIAEVVKFIDKNKYIIHSHEIREHFVCDIFPDFVVSQRISEQYNSIPKIQQPIFTEDMIQIMNKNLKENFEVRNLNGPLNKNKITIGMCGSLTDRKNYRLFIEVAKELKDFNFLWIGGSETIENKEIPNLFHIKDTKRPHSYYKYIDYFILFSKQDPCPYVVLENLYVGNKVLTFKENIYTDHKCDLLKDIYFEFDGEINLDNAIKFIQKICLNKADRSNQNGKTYIEENFTKLTDDMLNLLK